MDILDTLVKDLQTRRGDWPEIAKQAQVSYSWLTKLAQGRIPDPSIRRVFRVRAVLDEYEEMKKA